MRQFHALSQIIIVLSSLMIILYSSGNQISKNFAMLSLNIRTVASLLNMLLIVLMKTEKTFQTKSSKNASNTEDIDKSIEETTTTPKVITTTTEITTASTTTLMTTSTRTDLDCHPSELNIDCTMGTHYTVEEL